MKTGERSKLVRTLRQESRRFRLLVVVLGFFLVTLTFVVVSKPEAILFSLNGRLPADQAQKPLLIRQKVDVEEGASRRFPGGLTEDPKVVEEEEDVKPKWSREEQEEKKVLSEPEQASGIVEVAAPEAKGEQFGGEEHERKEEGKHKVTLPTVSNYTIHDPEEGDGSRPEDGKLDAEIKLETNPGQNDGDVKPEQPAANNLQLERQPLCDFSNFRANVCKMEGEIRIHPNATSVMYMEPAGSQRDELWKIKPYPRKGDEFCLSHITELTVKSSKVAPECTKYHDVPAVVFALTGYTGNLFHDFTDVLVPLFTTANEFNGEVQFLVTNMALWWTIKYQRVLQKLSNYPLIDFSKDDQVHCFKHAIVGLHAYMEFTIDSSKAPRNYSMVDFNRFMRGAYSLGRDAVTVLGENPKAKPRLLIISRQRTRMFLNLNEIVAMAEELGYEVVVDEANVSSDISRFAALVNSVDVMMGVHGAGLTNCVFLPLNATLIQIVPWGGLDWISRIDFGNPAEAMGLRYKQYSIGVDESSLTDQYPRDHEIFRNPISFHKRGFEFIRRTFMDKQNVRLDCKRFRPVLLEALDHLNP